jgi:hypothetical protein
LTNSILVLFFLLLFGYYFLAHNKTMLSKTKLFACAFLMLSCQSASFGQKTYDPNLNHFFMGRQQITITDDTPLVNDKTTSAAPGGKPNGALPGRPAPLPSAGWQSYSPASPTVDSKALPKVRNGVPEKAPPPKPSSTSGNKGRAGKLAVNKGKSKPSTNSGAPSGVSAYKPYATYSTPASPTAPSAAGTANKQTSSNVRGNLLHWARGNRGNQ